MNVVISQPMFFPWVGLFEQIRLADVYIHYDDVQFSKGSFINRVQVKTPTGFKWLSLPLRDLHLGQRINEVLLDDRQDWRRRHCELLWQLYRGAPYVNDMLALVETVYASAAKSLAELAIVSMEAIVGYFELAPKRQVLFASQMAVGGKSSQRVADLVQAVGGTIYITGHGAKNYLDHELFERRGVRVEYMEYRKVPYPQLHGAFTPYVSILDLIANRGKVGRDVICSGTTPWRKFVAA